MKKHISYLFLVATIIIWVFCLTLFILFITKYQDKITINKIIEQNTTITIVSIVLMSVLSAFSVGLYYYFWYKQMKTSEIKFTKNFTRHTNICTTIVFINLSLTSLFCALAAYNKIALNMIILFSIALAISSLAMITVAMYSYYLDIGYNYTINHANESARKEINNE